MAEPKREELNVKSKRGILVRVLSRNQRSDREGALEEIRGLATTAGVQVVHEMIQVRPKPHPATCLGSGKVEELIELVEAYEAELIVFDNNLTPAQSRNLEEARQERLAEEAAEAAAAKAAKAAREEAEAAAKVAAAEKEKAGGKEDEGKEEK